METRLRYIAGNLRSSYWFLPAVMMSAATALAFLTVWLDRILTPADFPVIGALIYTGGTDGAREVLAVVSGSMITVAGVVFSITIVTLQLASSQFGPRILASFMRDRGNQVTLGTFVATFLYALLILRTVRTDGNNAVPQLSVTVALLLAVAALSVLIFFIHHVSTTIQAPNLIKVIAAELANVIDQRVPAADGATHDVAATLVRLPNDFDERATAVVAPSTGYVQVVDFDHLVALGARYDVLVRLRMRPGAFLDGHTPFADVYPSDRVTADLTKSMQGAVATGANRSTENDVEFPIKQMVEIAVRALSPGINDPFTAGNCVDHLSASLCELAGRPMPASYFPDDDGVARVRLANPFDFEDLVGEAFDQIRQCADFHVVIYRQLLDSLGRIATCVRDPSRLEPLLAQGHLVLAAAERKIPGETDLLPVRMAYDRLTTAAVHDAD